MCATKDGSKDISAYEDNHSYVVLRVLSPLQGHSGGVTSLCSTRWLGQKSLCLDIMMRLFVYEIYVDSGNVLGVCDEISGNVMSVCVTADESKII